MLDVKNVAFLFIIVIILVVVMGMCAHGLFFFRWLDFQLVVGFVLFAFLTLLF